MNRELRPIYRLALLFRSLIGGFTRLFLDFLVAIRVLSQQIPKFITAMKGLLSSITGLLQNPKHGFWLIDVSSIDSNDVTVHLKHLDTIFVGHGLS